MSEPDKTTIKIRAYTNRVVGDDTQSNLSEEQNTALELVKTTAQLRDEKDKSLEQLKMIEHLQERLKQEQEKLTGMTEQMLIFEAHAGKLVEQESNVKKITELEARVKELSDVLDKISGIAAAENSD